MSKINDGGPAFPVGREEAISPVTDMGGNDVSSGMTLRDYFAGQALAGCCTHAGGWDDYETVVKAAYDLADAMLAARSKEAS